MSIKNFSVFMVESLKLKTRLFSLNLLIKLCNENNGYIYLEYTYIL